MARAALGWSMDDLAQSACLSRMTVVRFERGETVQPEKVEAMRQAFVAKGVRFLDGGNLAGGVVPPRS